MWGPGENFHSSKLNSRRAITMAYLAGNRNWGLSSSELVVQAVDMASISHWGIWRGEEGS